MENKIDLYNDDFNNIINKINFDIIITDPPYPDYMAKEYEYYDGIIDFCNSFKCKQLIFWSAKVKFPLDYTARHVWDKKCGVGSMYEFIYERNGGLNFRVYNQYLINSTVAASYSKDVFYNHPSQKPTMLMRKLILQHTNKSDIIFDPFMGSGSTAEAAFKEGRSFIGVEKNKIFFDIAYKRLKLVESNLLLF